MSYNVSVLFAIFIFVKNRITSKEKNHLFPANVWPKVKRRKLPPRLNDSRWHEQRDWFPSLFATAGSIRTVALWKSIGYIYIYICTRWKSADRRNKSGRLICGPGRRQLICLLFTGSRRGENNERTRTIIITMCNEDLIYTADRLEPINSVTITSPRFSMKREWRPLYGLAVCGQFKKLERISLFLQVSMF